ncbi:MAG: type 1 glutamine amidotransferase [Acidimicrobiales bacterium]
MAATGATATLTVVVVYPDLMGTYGDGGNGLVLARRAGWRGVDVNLVQALSDRPLPRGDIYCIGGGEDGPQVQAAALLISDGTLPAAVENGAVVIGVCAGFQLLGREFPDAADRPHDGLGLLDVTTRKGGEVRAVGELVAAVTVDAPRTSNGSTLPRLTGFENHGGITTIGPGARPLARVVTGVGNGAGDGTEGAWSGRVVGTYLHGPVLARNVVLADMLIGWALHPDGGVFRLEPLDDEEENALRAERLAAARRRALPMFRRLRQERP